MPLDPKLYFPGLRLTRSINSRAELAGKFWPTTSTLGALAMWDTGAKSFTASYGILGLSTGPMEWVELVAISRV